MLDPAAFSRVSAVLTDIDDTLTLGGRLEPEAFQALWNLQRAGVNVVAVTGRPAGWCDLIARQWPVAAVVGENGAFAMHLVDGHLRRIVHPQVAAVGNTRDRLDRVAEAVYRRVPGTRPSTDQFARLYDLAVDFREEPPELPVEAAQAVQSVAESFGAVAKISSIHVNIWFGEYSKLSMSTTVLTDILSIPADRFAAEVAYCGDSPNDEPMFQAFPLSIGVANVRDYLHLMTHHPTMITTADHGRGFAEFAAVLLSARPTAPSP